MSCLHCFNGRFGFTLFVNTPYFRTDTITNNPLIRADYLAGKGGFEPPVEFYPNNHLAGGPNQPLWHLPLFQRNIMAEREGFEPTVSFPTPVFKTGTINHSVISPITNRFYHVSITTARKVSDRCRRLIYPVTPLSSKSSNIKTTIGIIRETGLGTAFLNA